MLLGAINAEIGFLREQWEIELRKAFPELPDKKLILERLNELIRLRIPRMDVSEELLSLTRQLLSEQKQLGLLFLLPQQEEQWIEERLQPKWDRLLSETQAWDADRGEIRQLLGNLREAIWVGMDPNLAMRLVHLPEDLRTAWPKLVYTRFAADRMSLLDEIMELVKHPELRIPHKQHTRKVLTSLQALVRIISEVEKRTNTVISYLRRGISEEAECAV